MPFDTQDNDQNVPPLVTAATILSGILLIGTMAYYIASRDDIAQCIRDYRPPAPPPVQQTPQPAKKAAIDTYRLNTMSDKTAVPYHEAYTPY